MSVYAKRLREARLQAGLSQEKLGVLAGIDEASARARINQYEHGKHRPDFNVSDRIAQALNLPEPFFYAKDDEIAWLLVTVHRLPPKDRKRVIAFVEEIRADRDRP